MGFPVVTKLNSCRGLSLNQSQWLYSFGDHYSEEDEKITKFIQWICYNILLPVFCVFGMLGNSLSIFLISGSRATATLGRQNRRANRCLLALAISDFFFCLLAFPSSFSTAEYGLLSVGFYYYYHLVNRWGISSFILTSTWVTVTLAVERYIAICYPLQARKFQSKPTLIYCLVAIFIISPLFNAPLLWKDMAHEICFDEVKKEPMYLILEEVLVNDTIEQGLRLAWAVVGNVVPLFLLLFFNTCLIDGIRRSNRTRRMMTECHAVLIRPLTSQRMRTDHIRSTSRCISTNTRVNLTLVVIMASFLLLVAPCELIKHILVTTLDQQRLHESPLYRQGEMITNCMQALNFSMNFLFYCCFLKGFRRALPHLLCMNRCRSRKDVYGRESMKSERCDHRRNGLLQRDSHPIIRGKIITLTSV